MDSTPAEPLTQREVATDLKASLAARRELGDELEDHVLEAFLARVQQRIEAQVREQVQQQLAQSESRPVPRAAGGHSGRSAPAPWVVPAALGVAIPLVGAAGKQAGGIGVVAALVVVIAVIVLYFEYAKR